MIIRFNQFLLENNSPQEIIAYHSSPYEITEFNFDDIQTNPGSSTRMDALYFSNIPQNSWGENLYKVKIITENPAIFDLKQSRFDSLSVQEAFDTLLRGETSYMIEDLVEYGDMDETDAEDLVEKWEELDLIIINGENYSKHDTEYIVPNPYYNGHSAKIIILKRTINNEKTFIVPRIK
jgi:hypothetical protein